VQAWEWFVDHPETVTSTVKDVTGARASSFTDWATANAAPFC
jgi:homoserine acetyltransferase